MGIMERVTAVAPEADRRRRAAVAVGFVGVVVAGGWLVGAGSPGRVSVVEVPPADHVVPDQLEDGTPVWITRDGDRITVLEAVTPVDSPISGLVGWCGPGVRFHDPHTGLSFGPDGERYSGVVPARAAPGGEVRGLTSHSVQVGGDADVGDPVAVGDPVPAPVGTVDPPRRGELVHGPPRSCRAPDRRVGATPNPEALAGLADHSSLAQPLDPGRDGWQIAEGWLRIEADGGAGWCEGALTARGDTPCTPRPDVDVAIPVPPESAAAVTTVVGDPLAVEVDGGRIVAAAALPTSTWAGSSLQPAMTYRLAYLASDATNSRLLVHGPEPRRCVSSAPAVLGVSPDTSVVYIDVDTRVDVRSVSTVAGLRGLAVPTGGLGVEVVVDGVTCRTLAVRDPG